MDLPPETPIEKLRNLGKRCAEQLGEVGIKDLGELKEVGAEEAYARLSARYSHVNVIYLYTLLGALNDFRWNELPPPLREYAQKVAAELKLSKK